MNKEATEKEKKRWKLKFEKGLLSCVNSNVEIPFSGVKECLDVVHL